MAVPMLTSLRRDLAEIQGKIVGKAGKHRLAGNLSQHLWALNGKQALQFSQINREGRRVDQGNTRQLAGIQTLQFGKGQHAGAAGRNVRFAPKTDINEDSLTPVASYAICRNSVTICSGAGLFFRMSKLLSKPISINSLGTKRAEQVAPI